MSMIEELLALKNQYIALLEKASGEGAAFMFLHGILVSKADIDEGERLRKEITQAQASLAEPVTTRGRFIAFMQAIPNELPDPEVMLEQDGEYGVEWYWISPAGLPSQASVSVGKTGYSYASLIGGVPAHFGTDNMAKVITELRRVVPKKDTPETEASGGAER